MLADSKNRNFSINVSNLRNQVSNYLWITGESKVVSNPCRGDEFGIFDPINGWIYQWIIGKDFFLPIDSNL